MRIALGYFFSVALLGAASAKAAQIAGFPDWAYPPCVRATAEPDNSRPLSVAGSQVHFTAAQLARASITSDWFPLEHAKLPLVVAENRSEKKIACGYCHLPDGSGRPENAKIAGLPAGYIMAQVWSIHTQERQPAKPGWTPSTLMKDAIADLSDREIAEAADYFSHQSAKSYERVLERDSVPRHGVSCGIFIPADGRLTPLREAILEMPVDVERFERRDPHTRYIAYVPKGSIERGRTLAGAGDNGRTQPCAGCHGADLRSGPELEGPPLAGRFASYLFRQLYGFKSGARAGDAAQPMQSVVAKLTQADMIDLAAYAASLNP
ncbi:MAG TPA: c-type cytochrome [Steroidobacteraceae bacterium]|nr:c-type cytochrome [Steroidobacteraceae bacterium]